ncbi:hypothetical protein KY332_04445 [Candidatus Woesearchaeota archaeon]|nr:hypothetical protein [Candidatus Woesearchaeota archaeon]
MVKTEENVLELNIRDNFPAAAIHAADFLVDQNIRDIEPADYVREVVREYERAFFNGKELTDQKISYLEGLAGKLGISFQELISESVGNLCGIDCVFDDENDSGLFYMGSYD